MRGLVMFRRLIALSAVALVAAVGCTAQPKNAVAAGQKNEAGQPERNPNIGGALFPPAKDLPPPARVTAAPAEAILVPAHLTIVDKVDIPAQRDSRIMFIGTELKPGEQVADPRRLYKHRDKQYRRLEQGERVEPND